MIFTFPVEPETKSYSRCDLIVSGIFTLIPWGRSLPIVTTISFNWVEITTELKVEDGIEGVCFFLLGIPKMRQERRPLRAIDVQKS